MCVKDEYEVLNVMLAPKKTPELLWSERERERARVKDEDEVLEI